MNYDELMAKIDNKEYDSKLPFPSYATHNEYEKSLAREAKLKWREDENRLRMVFVSDLRGYIENELGTKLTDAQFSAIYDKAWDQIREAYKVKYPKCYALFHAIGQDKEWAEFVDILIELRTTINIHTEGTK